MVRVDQGLFGGALKEVIRMVGQELVKGIGGSNQHCQCRSIAAACPASLLPDACDGTRIPYQHGRFQPADVNSQFERICGNHCPDRPIRRPFSISRRWDGR